MVLCEYDGLGNVDALPLQTVETWVGIKGLLSCLRKEEILILIGLSMGKFLRAEPLPLKRGVAE